MKYFKEKETVRKLKDAKSTVLQKGVEGLQTQDTQYDVKNTTRRKDFKRK